MVMRLREAPSSSRVSPWWCDLLNQRWAKSIMLVPAISPRVIRPYGPIQLLRKA